MAFLQKPTGQPYTQPSYVQTSGGTKWSTNPGEPSSWQVVPMTDAAHQGEFKVVDSEGKERPTANFKSQQEATDYVNYKKGTPTGGGTGGGGDGTGEHQIIPASTYTVPANVLTADPTPDDLHPNWTNVDKSDPRPWRVVRNEEPFTTGSHAGQYGYKVVNKEGKNIAINFETKEKADAYFAAHQLAKQRGGYTEPTTGGGTLQIPGVAAVPPSGGTGEEAGGGTGTGGGGTGTGDRSPDIMGTLITKLMDDS